MAKDRVRLVRLGQSSEVRRSELYIERGDGFVQLGHFAGADDGGGDAGLRENPGERDLRVADAVLLRDFGDPIDNGEIGRLVVELLGVIVSLGAKGFAVVLFGAVAS